MNVEGRGGTVRWLRRGGSCVAFGYAVLVLTVGCVQRRLLYHPPPLGSGEVSQVAERHGFLPWTNAVGIRIGWFRSSTGIASEACVLIMHGNAGAAADRAYLADPIQAGSNVDVYVLEYPGFAGRPGTPSENSLTAAAGEALSLLGRQRPVYLVGESLGTGVACFLAGTRPAEVAGVILLTPFDRLSSVAAHHYPWIPVRMLLLDRFPSEEWLKQYSGPVGIVVGTADQVIPARFGHRLHAGYTGPKRFWEFEGEDHWDASHRPPEWWRESIGFLRAATVRR